MESDRCFKKMHVSRELTFIVMCGRCIKNTKAAKQNAGFHGDLPESSKLKYVRPSALHVIFQFEEPAGSLGKCPSV